MHVSSFIQFVVREVIPYEKAKEIERSRLKAQIEAAEKQLYTISQYVRINGQNLANKKL